MGASVLADPARLLTAWEAAAAVTAAERGAVLLHYAGAVGGMDEALDLPVGSLAALAAELYAATFGGVVDGVLPCDGCGELLDVQVPLSALPEETVGRTALVNCGAVTLEVRAPTTRDLVAAARSADPAGELLTRCVTGAVDLGGIPPRVRAELDAAAETLAGPAAVMVKACCPACGDEVRASLDVTDMLWQRLQVAAPAVLADVAELAAAFGWNEADVLAMSPTRRGAYLELARWGVA